MGGWMASKRKIKPGDVVIYVDAGEIVTGDFGKALIVIDIVTINRKKTCCI